MVVKYKNGDVEKATKYVFPLKLSSKSKELYMKR